MQVFPLDLDLPQSDCVTWASDVRAGVRAGVLELQTLLADKRVAHDIFRALMYRACGGKFFAGTCDPKKEIWVRSAIRRWRWLDQSSRV